MSCAHRWLLNIDPPASLLLQGSSDNSEHMPRNRGERHQLAVALERLAQVQQDLTNSQASLMVGQHQLAKQQSRLSNTMRK